eukprot:537993_1
MYENVATTIELDVPVSKDKEDEQKQENKSINPKDEIVKILTSLGLKEEQINKFQKEQINEKTLLLMTYDQFRDEMNIPIAERKILSDYIHKENDKQENKIEYETTDDNTIESVLKLLNLDKDEKCIEFFENEKISTKQELKQMSYTDFRQKTKKAVNILAIGPTVNIIHYIQQSDPLKSDELDICPSIYDIISKSVSKTTTAANDDEQNEFFQHLRNCCHFNDEFDVYQILAFESTLVERDIITLWKYRLKCLKGFLCAVTQIFGMIVVLSQLIKQGSSNKSMCNDFNSDNWEMNVLSFFLSTYLSYTTIKQLSTKKGLYQYIPLKDYDVKWLDHGWLYFGFVVNTVASVCAVWGSFFIIFYSQAAIDMVLNSVALFFLTELDDLLVNDEDYEEFEDSMNQYFLGRDKNKGILKTIFGKCGDGLAFTIFVIIGFPFEIVRYITIAACLTVPFYIAYCF